MFPQDLGGQRGIERGSPASHIARMNIVRYVAFFVFGMLLGLLLSALLPSLATWLFVH